MIKVVNRETLTISEWNSQFWFTVLNNDHPVKDIVVRYESSSNRNQRSSSVKKEEKG